MKEVGNFLGVILCAVFAFLVFILLSMLSGLIYDSISPPEKDKLFKSLNEKGQIEYAIDEKGNTTWKLKCLCECGKTSEQK